MVSTALEKRIASNDRKVLAVCLYAIHKSFAAVGRAMEITGPRAGQLYWGGCRLLVSHKPTMRRYPKEAEWVKLASLGMIETRAEQPSTAEEVAYDRQQHNEVCARRDADHRAQVKLDEAQRERYRIEDAEMNALDQEEADIAGAKWYEEKVLKPHRAELRRQGLGYICPTGVGGVIP